MRGGIWWACVCLAGGTLAVESGCGGDARMELSSADALGAVAGQMERTIREYHEEVSRFDDSRESGMVAAFVARVRRDATDEKALAAHAAEFEMALRKIRADRETEWSRRTAAMENVSVLREVSKGLQKLAIRSLDLRDQFRTYLEGWIEARDRATREAAGATTGLIAGGQSASTPAGAQSLLESLVQESFHAPAESGNPFPRTDEGGEK